MINLFEPVVSHRFLVSFSFGRIPSPLDMRFQRVSGLGRELSVSSYRNGGDNVGSVHFPEQVTHGSLVLERGVMTVTPLMHVFDDVLGEFNGRYVDVVVMLLNFASLPVCGWTFTDAIPVKWQTGDLDANSNTILINTLELAYRDMQWSGGRA